MPIATNPATGDVVFLDDAGKWQPATTAVNPDTQEMLAYDGKGWTAVPASKGVMARINEAFAEVKASPQPQADISSAAGVATSAVKNAPGSAVQFAKDIAQPFIHPIETGQAVGNLGLGIMEKIAPFADSLPGPIQAIVRGVGAVGEAMGGDKAKYADAVGRFFMDRYGSADAIKRAIATDPVGVLGDLSLVLTVGGSAAAAAPGAIGKAGEAVRAVGSAIDPVNAVLKGGGRAAAEVVGGLGTHTGGRAIVEAAQAGAEGGARGEAFRQNLRGSAPIEEVVTEAKAAVDELRRQRGVEYRQTMQKVGQDQTVLDFSKIDQAVHQASAVKTYKGQDLSPTTQSIRQQITDVVTDWRQLNPAEFHTPEGLDALKQKIGDIRDGTKYATPERKVADGIYQAVRQTIIDQVPDYAKIMKGYEEASGLIRDIENTLSLKPGANVDTAVRKLQSVLSNNVNTNYGRREALAGYLVNAGATNLVTKLAGQQLSSLLPRGLGKLSAATLLGGGGLASLTSGGLAGVAAAAALPLTSPRLVGEVAHGLARMHLPTLGRSAFQAGRETRASQ